MFLERSPNATINPSQFNGIGGKLELGEDYLAAAIRETKEETGYVVAAKDIQFCGIILFESQHTDDWITCFYKIKVASKTIPHGAKVLEGNLHWIHKDAVLQSGLNLVDDIPHIFSDMTEGNGIFFMNAIVEGKDFHIVKVNRTDLLI